jgi:elongation factor P
MALEVTEAEEGIRGDTVTGATKPVKTETGLEVRVPIFIKRGDKILVNTESGDYVERVNE